MVDLPTLLGLQDNPAELLGYGAITAELARELAADETATWRRMVTEPVTGHLLDYGTTVYRPPQRLRNYIIARSGVCVFPGCSQPAYRCQLDHRLPAEDGGPTSAENMHPLCVRHHQLKTHGGWTYRPSPDGDATWRTPTGASHIGLLPQRWQSGDGDNQHPTGQSDSPAEPDVSVRSCPAPAQTDAPDSIDPPDSIGPPDCIDPPSWDADRDDERARERQQLVNRHPPQPDHSEPIPHPDEHRRLLEAGRDHQRRILADSITRATEQGDHDATRTRISQLHDLNEYWQWQDNLPPDQPPF